MNVIVFQDACRVNEQDFTVQVSCRVAFIKEKDTENVGMIRSLTVAVEEVQRP